MDWSRGRLFAFSGFGRCRCGEGGRGSAQRLYIGGTFARARAFVAVMRARVCVHVEACVRGREKRADIESRSWLHSVGDARGNLACGRSGSRRMSSAVCAGFPRGCVRGVACSGKVYDKESFRGHFLANHTKTRFACLLLNHVASLTPASLQRSPVCSRPSSTPHLPQIEV